MACAAIAPGAETIKVKTMAASSSLDALTPHTQTHRKASKSICFKNTFHTPYWVVLEINDAPSAAKTEKLQAPGKTIYPALMMRWPLSLLRKKNK